MPDHTFAAIAKQVVGKKKTDKVTRFAIFVGPCQCDRMSQVRQVVAQPAWTLAYVIFQGATEGTLSQTRPDENMRICGADNGGATRRRSRRAAQHRFLGFTTNLG
ncbi:hypothetical protein LV28_22710 [Pandoraea pnomenusa]|jgi:hypothetical protein|nr:hypothetical protein LV28_22710 [Pandoraea pnomenusa]